MSATDELRRLLDERGVEWTAPNSILRDMMTCWTAGGFYYEAFEVPEPDGTFLLTAAHQDDLTPEQAIAATLGDADATPTRQVDAGTCRDIGGCRWFRCSACGFGIEDMYVNDEDEYPPADQPRYCPNCGRKVVDE